MGLNIVLVNIWQGNLCFRAEEIRRKFGNKQLSSSLYLSEAEPFLEKYAKRSPQNQALIGSAGNLVRAEDFLAIVAEGRDEEGDLELDRDAGLESPTQMVKDTVTKDQGLIVFFPGSFLLLPLSLPLCLPYLRSYKHQTALQLLFCVWEVLAYAIDLVSFFFLFMSYSIIMDQLNFVI